MFFFFILLSAVLGAAIGSFSLVVAKRTMRGESWWGASRSRCSSCKNTLSWCQMIPIVSFLCLRGRCRRCDSHISRDHITVEMITGAVYALSTAVIFDPGRLFPLLLWWSVLIPVCINTLSDLYQMKVLDSMNIALIVLGSVYTLVSGSMTLSSYLWGVMVGFFVFAVQFFLSRGRAIGSGDIYLGVAMGALLGWPLVLISIFFAYILGTVYVLPLLITRKVKLRSRIPLAPFLMVSMLICLFWGRTVLHIFRLT